MSLTKALHPDEKVKAGTLGSTLAKVGFAGGIIALVVAYLLGHGAGDHLRRFQYGYLTAWLFVWSIACGSLFFVLIHHLARARWGTVLRRIAENVALTFPVLTVLGLGFLLPMHMGNHELYYWSWFGAQPHEIQELNHHLHGKLGWLNPGFFTIRFLLYMAIYSGMAIAFSRASRQQDETGDPKLSEKMRVWSGPGMLVFSLTTVFLGFDVAMSLQPEWYSTIYSVNLFGGAMVATYAFLGLFARATQKSGRLVHSITVEHYHDVGKYLFGFTFFWIYTAFSQFLLIWYANIPEETQFYKYRMFTDWQYLSIALLIGAFAIPYVALLSRWTKRILPIFMVLCVWQLVFHYLDLFWNVMPNVNWGMDHGMVTGPLSGPLDKHTFSIEVTDILTLVAMVLLFLGAVGRKMKGNLLPVKDPNLGSSLAFENY